MIDLETLGTKHSSVFLSLAAVHFNLNTGQAFSVFNETVEINSALRAGLTIDGNTLKFWMKQKPEIMALMFEKSKNLSEVLESFSKWMADKKFLRDNFNIWGNSASFDLGILGNAYDAANIEKPWVYKEERCYRTLIAMWPDAPKPEDNKAHHDPLQDCVYQINRLTMLWRYLHGVGMHSEMANSFPEAITLLHEVTLNDSPAVAQYRKKVENFLNPPFKNIVYKFENPNGKNKE